MIRGVGQGKYTFLIQTEPGKLLSDELGKASEARPFPKKKQGGFGVAARILSSCPSIKPFQIFQTFQNIPADFRISIFLTFIISVFVFLGERDAPPDHPDFFLGNGRASLALHNSFVLPSCI